MKKRIFEDIFFKNIQQEISFIIEQSHEVHVSYKIYFCVGQFSLGQKYIFLPHLKLNIWNLNRKKKFCLEQSKTDFLSLLARNSLKLIAIALYKCSHHFL